MERKVVMVAILLLLAVTGINAQIRVNVYSGVPVYQKHRHYHRYDDGRYNNYYGYGRRHYRRHDDDDDQGDGWRYQRRGGYGYGRDLPPGQAKKIYGYKSAREFSRGHGKKWHGDDWDD